jgi:hypothetical protein
LADRWGSYSSDSLPQGLFNFIDRVSKAFDSVPLKEDGFHVISVPFANIFLFSKL